VPKLFSGYKKYHPTTSHLYFTKDAGDMIPQTIGNFLPEQIMAPYPRKQYSL